MASNFTVGVCVTALVYELFILLVGVLGADLHKGGYGWHDDVEDGYCRFFQSFSFEATQKSNTNLSSIILFRSDANPTYQITDCLWFGSVCVMFVSVLQIVYWTGRCDCTVNRNVNIFMAFLLFLSIVLVIAAASIFTANYGDQRCGSGDMETTCESEIFFLYGSPFPIRAMILYFKMQDLHWVR